MILIYPLKSIKSFLKPVFQRRFWTLQEGAPPGTPRTLVESRMTGEQRQRHRALSLHEFSGVKSPIRLSDLSLPIGELVGGLEHFLFSHILGIIIPIDFHIFQRGGPTTNQPIIPILTNRRIIENHNIPWHQLFLIGYPSSGGFTSLIQLHFELHSCVVFWKAEVEMF